MGKGPRHLTTRERTRRERRRRARTVIIYRDHRPRGPSRPDAGADRFEQQLQGWFTAWTMRGALAVTKFVGLGFGAGSLNYVVHTYVTDNHIVNALVVAGMGGVLARVTIRK